MFENLSWISPVSCIRSAIFSLYILPFLLFWASGKQWFVFSLLGPLPFPANRTDHCQWPFTFVNSLFWDVICLGQEPWIYSEQLRFVSVINSSALGFNSLMAVCTTCFSLTITLLDGRGGGKREVVQFCFLFATNSIYVLRPCLFSYCPSKHMIFLCIAHCF